MSRFNTLLLREWMQHRRGWLILVLAPPLLILLLLPFGSVELSGSESSHVGPFELMLITMLAVPLGVLTLTAIAVAFQASGLARRDQQDRSIEFWLSLPTTHSASIGATLLAHLLLLPLAAMTIGMLLGPLMGMAMVTKAFGASGLLGLPWGSLIALGGLAWLRAAFGVLLACLWLSPLLLATMAASAWLKRWGVPALALGFGVGAALLSKLYGIHLLGDAVLGWVIEARRAILFEPPTNGNVEADTLAWLADFPAWLAHDAFGSLTQLAQPLFGAALIVAAIGFALLVLRRSRAG